MHSSQEKGFTILLAALVGSLVLALGISVFSIAQKQLTLATTGRNSQYAFYAADTAAECALYWDVRYGFFGSSTATMPPRCDAQDICNPGSPCELGRTETLPYTMSFEFEPNGYCARVSVTKSAATGQRTLIRSDGFSVRCSEIEASSRALQRSVELTY